MGMNALESAHGPDVPKAGNDLQDDSRRDARQIHLSKQKAAVGGSAIAHAAACMCFTAGHDVLEGVTRALASPGVARRA